MSTEAQFQAAMAGAGLMPPETINADGHRHRFGVGGKSCWYVLHLDGIPAGSYGDWKTGHTETWCAKSKADMSDAERQATWDRIRAAQRQRDAERDRIQAEAASRALAIWTAAAPSIEHPYLTRKAIKPHGIRTDGHHLFVPMRCTAGKLHSLQTIDPDGEKRFLPSGRVKGTYFAMGKPDGIVILCEGLATGATIHERGAAVAVCFSAGNLLPVALSLREKYPDMSITVAADDDWQTPGNPGISAATAAASAVGGKLAVPNFDGLARGIKDTDFNDMARLIREKETAP